MTKEEKFLQSLKDIFVGAPVEGESGYINLMRIKASYFDKGVFPRLMQDIERALEPFPSFREELFDKLHSFFRRYFSESGSIYYRYTPLHERVYEKVYTDDRDVMLFWKTHMLYYVKTDRLFQGMDVKVDDFRFFFDVSALEHKRANEKRALVFDYQKTRADGRVVFTVTYSERGRKTKIGDIRRAIKDTMGLTRYTDAIPSEETLEQAFRLFERQSEVDYFINKNARAFLCEQFDLWLYQYVFEPEQRSMTLWTETRIRQLQILKDIAYKIIDFIAQFEDELVRIWNKPKFVLNANYIITINCLVDQEGGLELLERFLENPGIGTQVQEWCDLGMVGEDFEPQALRPHAGQLHPRYRYLPLDTRHFPELVLELLACFDDIDQQLDGWLIKSENYQALNTLMPKLRERVKCIYIDPPFNRPDQSEILYIVNYKRASWLSLMENRIELAQGILGEGVLIVAIDDHEFADLTEMLDRVFRSHTLYHVVVNHHPQGSSRDNVSMSHEYMLFAVPQDKNILRGQAKDGKDEMRPFMRSGSARNNFRYGRPNSFYALLIDPKLGQIKGLEPPPDDDDYPQEPTDQGYERVYPIGGDGRERVWRWSYKSAKKQVERLACSEKTQGGWSVYQVVETEGKHSPLKSNWTAKRYNAGTHGTNLLTRLFNEAVFDYPKSVYTVMDAVNAIPNEDPHHLVLDFFAGSGTTAHAIINLNREDGGRRRYVLVEMADYFDTVLLPRVKKVAFSDRWKDGQAEEGGQGIRHFVKYFHIEQYEDVLRRAHYADVEPLFVQGDPYSQYVFLRDTKLLDNAENSEELKAVVQVDPRADGVRVDLGKLYDNVDLAETLSCITGKWIRRLTEREVELEDGTRLSLENPDWQLIKPLIWW